MPGVRGGHETVYVEGPTPMKRQPAEALGLSNVLPGRPRQGEWSWKGKLSPPDGLSSYTSVVRDPNRGMNGYGQ